MNESSFVMTKKSERGIRRKVVLYLAVISLLLLFGFLYNEFFTALENGAGTNNGIQTDHKILGKDSAMSAFSDTNAKHVLQHISANPRYVTVLLPSVVNPKGRSKRLDSISRTWGPFAHAIYVTHPGTDSDYTLQNTDSNSFPKLMPIEPHIATEEDGVARLKYVISQVYQQYNPDFVFFANDHTFIIPQHLCSFLESHKFDPEEHLYAGHALRPKNQKKGKYAFNSGASGYFLSRKSMKELIDAWERHDEHCESTRKWLQGNPGLLTAECLKHGMGIDVIDTRDESKRHVFHAFGIVRVVKNEMDEWYKSKHEDLAEILGEDHVFHHELQSGVNCCSPMTASFHYVEWKETLALWNMLSRVTNSRDSSNNIAMSDNDIKTLINEQWPTEKKDVGGYAHNLPPEKKTNVWNDLIQVIKMISPLQQEGFC